MNLTDILAKRPEQGYRFLGRVNPADRERTPVLASIDVAVSDATATLYLYDPIDSWGGEWGVSAKEFTAALASLPDTVTSVNLRINSPGGEVFEGIAIANAIRNSTLPITAHVDGIAASAASFIAVACDGLVMGRNTELMIHDAWGLAIGNAEAMHSTGDLLNHLSDNIAAFYAEKASGDAAGWREVMRGEAWYSADEAVTAGLADSVAEPVEKATVAAAFDLSMFAHAGRTDAPPAPAPVVPAAAPEASVVPARDFPAKAAAAASQDRRHRLALRAAAA